MCTTYCQAEDRAYPLLRLLTNINKKYICVYAFCVKCDTANYKHRRQLKRKAKIKGTLLFHITGVHVNDYKSEFLKAQMTKNCTGALKVFNNTVCINYINKTKCSRPLEKKVC